MVLAGARVEALIVTAILIAACSSDEERLPPSDERGWSGEGARVPGEDDPEGDEPDGDDQEGDDSEGDEDAGISCTDQGGQCLSDPIDPSLPAFCEEIELVEIVGACEDLDQSCCAPAPSSQCEAAGGQCLADPAGGGLPIDCADLGLANIGATCPDIDQTCCG
jgi:hypothetical protein